MTNGLEIEEIKVGDGQTAVREKTAVVNARIFLNHGTEIIGFLPSPRFKVDLSRRDVFAGLRYGIEGMRVGGRRKLIISPHLACGAEGIPGKIPPNAVLRCDVELLEVRDSGVLTPEDYPPGKYLIVFYPGEEMRSRTRWQFGLFEDGRCGVFLTTLKPGLKWRHARPRHLDLQVEHALIEGMFRAAIEFPRLFPDVVSPADVNPDAEGLLVSVTVQEKDRVICRFSVPETSSELLASDFFKAITLLLAPYLPPRVNPWP